MSGAASAVPRPAYRGLAGWAGTTDHKRLGILAGATALVFFAVGGALALVIRAQLSEPDAHVVSQDVYDQIDAEQDASERAKRWADILSPLVDLPDPPLGGLTDV